MTKHEHDHSAAGHDVTGLAEMLDLDAEVTREYGSEVTGWLAELTADRPPRRILDLGSGTGAGTFALLERFGEADATALDVSPQMLHHLRKKAQVLGLGERVRTVEADLDARWPAVDTADLAWAASSLHHLADPDHALAEVFVRLRPGGLLAVTEMDFFPRFLPGELGMGRPGLETRIHAALDRAPNEDPAPLLLRAGFSLDEKRSFAVDLRDPLPAAAARYAQVCLRRMRGHLGDLLDADDLAALDVLVDDDSPEGVLNRRDLHIRTTRTVWVAGRP